MGLGLWRLRYYAEWLPRDAPEIGLRLAFRKHRNLLHSWDAPARMPAAPVHAGECFGTIHLLTGQFHAHLTAFCLYSLLKQSQEPVNTVIHDDGTLKDEQRDQLSRIAPSSRFLRSPDAESLTNEHFPRERFPALRAMRDRLHLMRKLLDVHAGGGGPALFVDSDVFFFRHPALLFDWMRGCRPPLYMADYQDSYGHAEAALHYAYGKPLPARVNTGLCGFDSPSIDWPKVEFWAARLLSKEGVNHFSEQALTAMLLGDMGGEAAPERDYMISPALAETKAPTAVMHHYVVPSRTWYYTEAIPAFLRDLGVWT